MVTYGLVGSLDSFTVIDMISQITKSPYFQSSKNSHRKCWVSLFWPNTFTSFNLVVKPFRLSNLVVKAFNYDHDLYDHDDTYSGSIPGRSWLFWSFPYQQQILFFACIIWKTLIFVINIETLLWFLKVIYKNIMIFENNFGK